MAAITKQKQHLDLDGKAIIDAKLINCTVGGKRLEDGLGGGGADSYFDVEGAIPTTMSELRRLANDGELEAGRCYRVTDYEFITNKAFTASAGHKFDIIVKATAEDWIPYKAMAVPHVFESNKPTRLSLWMMQSGYLWITRDESEDITVQGVKYYAWAGDGTFLYTKTDDITPDEGWQEGKRHNVLYTIMEDDTPPVAIETIGAGNYMIDGVESESEYFANTDFSKWELEYDAGAWEDYDWVSEDDDCGVIRYMKDEFGNEAPYDFKNMLFDDGEGGTSYTFDDSGDESLYGNYERDFVRNSPFLGSGNYYIRVSWQELFGDNGLGQVAGTKLAAMAREGLSHKVVFWCGKHKYPVLCSYTDGHMWVVICGYNNDSENPFKAIYCGVGQPEPM